MFEVNASIQLTWTQYQELWPFVTNMWYRNDKGKVQKTGTRVEVWYCRNRRSGRKSKTALGVRNKAVRVVDKCHVQLKVIIQFCNVSIRSAVNPLIPGSSACWPEFIQID